ncbi:TadE/TadG family type IV pilus assembly protein [Erwinia sp. V71]|uniref:TadE/TadG family type IV pilus assembly protein n=1 Tax=Erwinia sp. V71 TaxID=3369424 RepID=UPI003F5DDA11
MSNWLRRGWRELLQQQRGVVAVETALAFPILLAAGALVADIVTVELEREHLEQRAGAITSVLAMQKDLTEQGLQGLLDATLPDTGVGEYQLTITNVRQTGNVYWQLNRGNNTTICTDNQTVAGESYPGELPEVDAEKGEENISMIVVELCRRGEDINLLGGLSLTNMLQATAVNRVTRSTVTLDDALAAEAGLEQDDE